MDLVLIPREQDKEYVRESYNRFINAEEEVLLAAYNREAKLGLVGVTKQGLHLIGLHHAFMERFGTSPIRNTGMVVGLTGILGSIEELKSKNHLVKIIFLDKSSCFIRFKTKIAITEPQISLLSYLEKSPDGLILSKAHSEMHTQIHLRGVAPYILLKFDEENQFESADLSTNVESLFTVQTTSTTVLVLKLPLAFQDKKIDRIIFQTN